MKTQKQISKQREMIEFTIDAQRNMLKFLQTKCTHPNVVSQYKADTGNYDKSQDRYWVEFRCPDCGKQWMEDQ
jgi:predicted RNA-binding Zn-ribbon protein involved in translation (DUF1610 family)